MTSNIKPVLPKLPIRHSIYKQQLSTTSELASAPKPIPSTTKSIEGPLFADISQRDKTKKVVASFDVGIKHLAYCVLSYSNGKYSRDADNHYVIYDWGIINLTDDEEPQICCQVLPKTKQACGKKAGYIVGTESYCGMHIKRFNSADVKPIKAPSKQRIESISIQDLCITLVEKLDAVPIFLEVDEILIEQQPAKASNRFGKFGSGPDVHPRMKNLSYMIYSYFIMRGVIANRGLSTSGTTLGLSTSGATSGIKAVKFINSNNKLKLYDGPPIVATQKNPYNRNKFMAKEHLRYILRNRSKLLAFFEDYKKKDDLADCFLQGAWYLAKG